MRDTPSTPELFNLDGHVAVVTGAGRGIGEGIARSFVEAGASVVVAARRVDEIALTWTLSAELAPDIRVNAIAPGAIPTEIMLKAVGRKSDELDELLDEWQIPLGRLGTPQDIGAACVYLASDAASWVTGEILRVGGGAKAR